MKVGKPHKKSGTPDLQNVTEEVEYSDYLLDG